MRGTVGRIIFALAACAVSACGQRPAEAPAATQAEEATPLTTPPATTSADLSLPYAPTGGASAVNVVNAPAAATDPAAVPPPAPAQTGVSMFVKPLRLVPRENGSRIRQRPSTSADTPTIAATRLNTPLIAIGAVQAPDGRWFQVRLDDGRIGYIRADLVVQPLQ